MAERRFAHPVPRDVPHDSIGASIGALADDTSRLIHLEVSLLKQEITDLVKRNAIAAGLLAGAALCLLLVLIFLLVFVIELIPHHAIAAAVVAITWLIATVVLALVGKSRLHIAGPEASIQSIKEDLEWVKQQLRPEPK
ncbi:MAG: phage holin family protein [Candidatus Dormibacteria bacterium]